MQPHIAGREVRVAWAAYSLPVDARRKRALLSAIAVLFSTCVAFAQSVLPRVGYAYPAGGRAGTTVQTTVGGQRLQTLEQVYISGDGISAKVIDHTRPLSPKEMLLLRDKLKELMEKQSASKGAAASGNSNSTTRPAWTPDDDKTLVEVKKKLANYKGRPANPAIAETVTLEITVARDATPGERELRLYGPTGLTNPLVFCISQICEFSQDRASTSTLPAKRAQNPPRRSAGSDIEVKLPAVVNGQIEPGEVDQIRFRAEKSERFVAVVNARSLIPYLPDAVPGWFQPTLKLMDAQGKELAYDDDFRFQPDPILMCQIPANGEYVLEINDALYRGRDDFVYRITMGSLPLVTGIYPLGSAAGAPARVELQGFNLPLPYFMRKARDEGAGIFPLSSGKSAPYLSRVLFAQGTLPECLEKEPNDRPASAQVLTLPILVNGRIGKAGDEDFFQFDGHAGATVVAEVMARRLNSALDSQLELIDSSGHRVAFSDDYDPLGGEVPQKPEAPDSNGSPHIGLDTHYADSYLRTKLPSDGSFMIHISDAQHKGGVEFAYRLRISTPRPDFELRITPASLTIRPGGTAMLMAYALRQDGFSGDIAISLKNPPAKFKVNGGRIPAGQTQAQITLVAPPRPLGKPVELLIEGRASIQDREVIHQAEPAEDMMQAFAYHHLVPRQQLVVANTFARARR